MTNVLPTGTKEFSFYPNSILKLFLTNACNNACYDCFNSSSCQLSSLKKQNLTWKEIKRTLLQAKKSLGMYLVEFSGGEALLRYKDLLKAIKYAKALGFKTRLYTNGGLIGATGSYKKQLKENLKNYELASKSPKQIVKELFGAGLDSVYISIDSKHTIEEKNYDPQKSLSRVPVNAVVRCLKTFLDFGFGKKRGKEFNQLDRYGIKISLTASGVTYGPSFKIIDEVMDKLGGLYLGKAGNLRIFQIGDQKIAINRLNVADIGLARSLPNQYLNPLREKIFTLDCPHFRPRSQATEKGRYHQDLAVNYDGSVYTCATQAFLIGSIRRHSLKKIVNYVNRGVPPKPYRTAVYMFRELLKIASETKGSAVIGEALRRINKVSPALIKEIRTHAGACYQLGHDQRFLSSLKLLR